MSRSRCRTLLAAIALVLSPSLALAQKAPPAPTAAPRDMRELLDRLAYDPAERGPLLVVAPPASYPPERLLPPKDRPAPSLGVVAEAFGRRVFSAGGVTVLAPRDMVIINTDPGKARVMMDLNPSERVQALLSMLSEAQWQKACGDGLAMGDLSDDQRALFDTILPRELKAVETHIEAVPNNPRATRYNAASAPQEFDRNLVRLRFSLNTFYEFWQVNNSARRAITGLWRSPKAGDTIWNRVYSGPEESPGGPNPRKEAFGVPILKTVPNRLKPGELDYSAPALNALADLPEDTKTVEGLLGALGAQVGLELLADRRIGKLPLYLKAAPGQLVRVGDVLEALALGVTGAYRHMSRTTFLLTDDIEGIGTRFARLSAWAEAAETEKQEQMAKALERVARQNPLAHLRYAPDSPAPLPTDIIQRIEQQWVKNRYAMGVDVNVADLPANVRKDVEEQAKVWDETTPPLPVQTNRVTVGMGMTAVLVLPNGGVIQDPELTSGMGLQFLGKLTPHLPEKPAADAGVKTTAPAAKPKLPSELKRRILLAAPGTPEDAQTLVAAAGRHGFTEVWVHLTLDRSDAAPLKAATASGKRLGLPVYASVSLLRGCGVGELDRNILGQTGAEFAKQMYEQERRQQGFQDHPELLGFARLQTTLYAGWVVPTPEVARQLARRVAALIELPGLSGLILCQTGGPGYTADPERGGDAVLPNGQQGYTLPMRLAFLRKEGIDPVDMVDNPYYMNVDHNLPFFGVDEFHARYRQIGDRFEPDPNFTAAPRAWLRFRGEQNRALLTRVYATVREVHPDLPVYLDDRVSGYGLPNTSWFVRWDAAEQIPHNPAFSVESESLAAARAVSNTVLLRFAWDGMMSNPQKFAEAIQHQGEKAMKDWDGLVVDVTMTPSNDALHLLAGLADVKPAPKVP